MADPDPGPEPDEPPGFSDQLLNQDWWPYEDMAEPPPCVWLAGDAIPACDWDKSCEDHGWASERQKKCQRCRGTGIDPEHSDSGGMEGGVYMEPPVLEPCMDCQFTVDLIKRSFRGLLHYPDN